jgi:prepilin-type N-terminal cleavage/methylation domain-containing protein
MQTKIYRQSGFTLVEIMIVVGILGLLIAIALPNFLKARTTAQRNACIANLRQISGAIDEWALESRKTSSDTYNLRAIRVYLKGSRMPRCPAGGRYVPGATVADPAACSLSASQGHSI